MSLLSLHMFYFPRSAVLQWGDLASVIFAAFLLLSDKIITTRHIFASSAVVAVCPGIRLASLVCMIIKFYIFHNIHAAYTCQVLIKTSAKLTEAQSAILWSCGAISPENGRRVEKIGET